MPNRLYNKQVSPKGYKMGGRVKKMGGGMMKRKPMMKGSKPDFLDLDKEMNSRVSLGSELKAANFNFTGNYYLGLSGAETINGVKEKVLDGHEINLSSQLPFMPWTRLNVQNYDFEKDKASENTDGNLVSLEMNLTPSIQFEASKNFISTTGVEDEENFKIMYYNPPRNKSSLQDGFLSSTAFEKGDVEAKMKDKVRRRNAMTIEVQGAVVITKQ